ncbi:expressed protein, partial [Phakopsora pachyrhizi]
MFPLLVIFRDGRDSRQSFFLLQIHVGEVFLFIYYIYTSGNAPHLLPHSFFYILLFFLLFSFYTTFLILALIPVITFCHTLLPFSGFHLPSQLHSIWS